MLTHHVWPVCSYVCHVRERLLIARENDDYQAYRSYSGLRKPLVPAVTRMKIFPGSISALVKLSRSLIKDLEELASWGQLINRLGKPHIISAKSCFSCLPLLRVW